MRPITSKRLRSLRNQFRRQQNQSGPSSSHHEPPTRAYPSPEEMQQYPAPASLVVQGAISAQLQSPLFGRLPPEIRNEIFRLVVLREYVREDRLWSRDTFYTRPGFEGPKSVDLALLRTCRRAYEETKMLPLRDGQVGFWMGSVDRAPPSFTYMPYGGGSTLTDPRVHWFKPEHWARITHFHIFGQMYILQQQFGSLFSGSHLGALIPNVSKITLTLRYTDWWNWESNAPIAPLARTQFFPLPRVGLPDSVTTMVVQFESREGKLSELNAAVAEMFVPGGTPFKGVNAVWQWHRRDGRALSVKGSCAEGDGVRTWKWDGPTSLGDGQKYRHHGEGETMVYVVKEVTWQLDAEQGPAAGVVDPSE